MKRFVVALFSVIILTSPARGESVRLSVTASMTEVVNEIINNFRSLHADIPLLTNFGSSGSLAKQISHGAPVDIFVSANPKWMELLSEKKLIVQSTFRTLAYNKMVFVGSGAQRIKTVHSLLNLERIAIGNPANVPAGMYARQAMQRAGVYNRLEEEKKLVLAKDVRQALLYAEMGEVDGAFVYRTDASLAHKTRILFEIPGALHDKVSIPIAITSSGNNNKSAHTFYDYMVSAAAMAVLDRHGFEPVL